MISDTQTQRDGGWTDSQTSQSKLARAHVSSSLTSANVAIEAYSESKVGGELDLLGVHRDGQTINRPEWRCNTLPIQLEGTQYNFTVSVLTQDERGFNKTKTNYWPGRSSSAGSGHWRRRRQCTSDPGTTPSCCLRVSCSFPSPRRASRSSAGCGSGSGRRCRGPGSDGWNHRMFGGGDRRRCCTCRNLSDDGNETVKMAYDLNHTDKKASKCPLPGYKMLGCRSQRHSLVGLQ